MAKATAEGLLLQILGVLGVSATSAAVLAACGAATTDTGSSTSRDGVPAGGAGGTGSQGGGAGSGLGAGLNGSGGYGGAFGGASGSVGVGGSGDPFAPGTWNPVPVPPDIALYGYGGVECVSTSAAAGSLGSVWQEVCVATPADASACAPASASTALASMFSCGLTGGASIVCGAREGVGTADGGGLVGCCYALGGGCAVGRPFVVAGVARLASAAPRADWSAALAPNVAELDPATRAALAEAYARDGVTEHASIASFARFALHCLALGAPAELVRAAQQAGLEELGHAEQSFGLASAYAGERLGPAELDVAGALDGAVDAESIALAVAREGCVAETVSALLAAAARDAATDPVVCAVLTRVAEEELEHALLAWRFMRWLLVRHPSLRGAVASVFVDRGAWVGFGSVTSLPGVASLLRAHGYLPIEERHRVAEHALGEVVAPAARALLDGIANGQPHRSAEAPAPNAWQ